MQSISEAELIEMEKLADRLDIAIAERVESSRKHHPLHWGDIPEYSEEINQRRRREFTVNALRKLIAMARAGDLCAECGAVIGRWPANVILDPVAAELLDLQSGITVGNGEARTFSRLKKTTGWAGGSFPMEVAGTDRNDSGGASRFFYTAKADSNERGTGNNHPTVKPLDLMRYLCKLLCPPTGGALLDPFMGSGSTLLAGRRFFQRVVGIEIEERYCEIAAKRLAQEVFDFEEAPVTQDPNQTPRPAERSNP